MPGVPESCYNVLEAGAAFQHIRDNLDELNGRAGASDTDLVFLKGLMDSPVFSSLVKVQDRLEEANGISPEPVGSGNILIAEEIREGFKKNRTKDAVELTALLTKPHVQSLLKAHDDIADKSYDPPEPPPSQVFLIPPMNGEITGEPIRMVGLRRNPDEPLGVTVREEHGELVIARILDGGMIDRQGLLHVGDVIKEVNGEEVSTPDELMSEIKKARDSVTLKVLPACFDLAPSPQVMASSSENTANISTCFMRALFNYDPNKDSLLPCPEIGLRFQQGDILQIVDQRDPNWWQARRIDHHGRSPAKLIPSQELEERRQAFVRPEYDYVHKTGMCGAKVAKKKRKTMYKSMQNAEFDKAELILYEEVVKTPPFQRKTLVLVGTQGVGRRTLKNRLINIDPERFSTVVPCTSRPMRDGDVDGHTYSFSSREAMEQEIALHKFLEYGEHGGQLYGTKFDSIRNVIRSGKMCILDCGPQALKLLHNSTEFQPFVVFVAAPGMEQLRSLNEFGRMMNTSNRYLSFDRTLRYSSMYSKRARTLESLATLYEEEDLKRTLEESAKLQRAYEKYFDLVIVNHDLDETFHQLQEAVDNLASESQWVPAQWVY